MFMELTIQKKWLIRILIRITFVLIFLSLLTVISISVFDRGNLLGLVPMFNMDRESNIPTLFSFLLLLSGRGALLPAEPAVCRSLRPFHPARHPAERYLRVHGG